VWGAGGMAQDVGPEFKTQYGKKKKEEIHFQKLYFNLLKGIHIAHPRF
jgi:hypothetical protein